MFLSFCRSVFLISPFCERNIDAMLNMVEPKFLRCFWITQLTRLQYDRKKIEFNHNNTAKKLLQNKILFVQITSMIFRKDEN